MEKEPLSDGELLDALYDQVEVLKQEKFNSLTLQENYSNFGEKVEKLLIENQDE